jgi:hypothetical protein
MFKIIFIFLLLLAFVPSLRRFLFWLVVGRQMVKEQKRYQQPQDNRREGDISVDATPKSRSNKSGDSGQYIDYEEVK